MILDGIWSYGLWVWLLGLPDKAFLPGVAFHGPGHVLSVASALAAALVSTPLIVAKNI